MKWLLLILVIACGTKTPPAQDVGDSDGDQIPNYLETDSELQKYVAEVVPFSEIKASLTFKNENKLVVVDMTNQSDLALNAQKLLTKTLSTLKMEDHFSEWSRMRIESPETHQIKDQRYVVTMSFRTTERPETVLLDDGKAEVVIGKFSQRMEFELTGDELNKILTGKSFLKLQRKEVIDIYSPESTVRERTYRVYFYDGRSGKIHYVSKELPFERYLKLSGIVESHELKSMKGFTFIESAKVWWTRALGEEDKVVVHSSLKKLADFHLSNFIRTESEVVRTKGVSGKALEVKKASGTKFVMKFRGKKQTQIFKVVKDSWVRGGGRGEIHEECRSWTRSVDRKVDQVLTKELLLENLVFQSADKTMGFNDLSEHIVEGEDEKGPYLELSLDQTPEAFKILLPTRPASTFVELGVYRYECIGNAPRTVRSNEEGQMVINVESFIEKID